MPLRSRGCWQTGLLGVDDVRSGIIFGVCPQASAGRGWALRPSRGDPGLGMLEGTFGSAWLANKMRGASDDE
jgi:hypothetical protein